MGLPNERMLWRLVAAGQVATVKVGRRTFVRESECVRFVASLDVVSRVA